MSGLEGFERWWLRFVVDKLHHQCSSDEHIIAEQAWQACAEQKDKEIEALRGFAEFVLAKSKEGLLIGAQLNWILLCGETHNLIDENGNPTKILTGENGE